jgi:hypothetical protein
VSVIEPGFIAGAMPEKLQRDTDAWLRQLPEQGRETYGRQLTAIATKVGREATTGSRRRSSPAPSCTP